MRQKNDSAEPIARPSQQISWLEITIDSAPSARMGGNPPKHCIAEASSLLHSEAVASSVFP